MFRQKYLLSSILIMTALFTTACTTAKKEEVKTPTPTQPQVGVSAKKSYIFTANEGGSISKIDAATNKVINTLSTDGAVHNVQISPDGKVIGAIVAPEMETQMEGMSEEKKVNGSAVFYDTETDKLIKKVEVGSHPAHIVFSGDGKYALVTNNGDNNVSVIDAKTYEVVKTISTGNGPHGFRISKDSKFTYVANLKEDTVSVLDLGSFTEVKKIKVGNAPVTTGITNDGKTLITSVNSENVVAVIDIDTDKVEKIPVGKGPAQVFIQNDDKYVFVANQGTEKEPSNTVTKIDLSSRKVVATITTGKGTHGVVTSSDNKYVYVTNMFDDTVSVIDNDKNNVIATIKVSKTPNGISYKP